MLAQVVKPRTVINETESMQLTRNLIRIAISEISYIRGLFPEKYFVDRHLPALDMKVKKLMPLDAESRRLIDWMEKGVYDALQNKYLETLFFRLCDGEDGPMIEEYVFSFQYDVCSDRVSMDITRSKGHGRKGNLMNTNSADITPVQMKAAACKMIRTLVQLMRTLNNVPEQRTIVMQLYYNADTTPASYEPPFFRSCTYEDTKLWAKKPLKMKAGSVNSKYCEVSLKVRTVLDPCEDDSEEDDMKSSSTDGIAAPSTLHKSIPENHMICTTSRKPALGSEEIDGLLCGQKTVTSTDGKDMARDSQSEMSLVTDIKEWATIQISNTFDEIDVFAYFPQIPMAQLEEILRRLVEDHFIEKIGQCKYRLTKSEEQYQSDKNHDDVGLQNTSPPAHGQSQLSSTIHDHDAATDTNDDENETLFEKALKVVLPMKHVTVRQLIDKMENVSPSKCNQLLQRMGKEGYIEATPSSRRLGRRVLRPVQNDEYQLQEIVEGVKEVVIAAADDSSEERLNSHELRSKREDSDYVRISKKNSEIRRKGKNDVVKIDSNPCEPALESETTLKSGVRRSLQFADNEDASFDPTENSDVALVSNVDKDKCSDHERPDCPTTAVFADSEFENPETDKNDKEKSRSHHRIRKASKVEEPIHQSLMSSTKRLRSTNS
ncbi:meiosis-specific protein [Marchantia polymorpha subsp. ruderalis]|uniref:HORMA domain-containing protein n=2 Tax=Marchantia polymorpha TaxID=3197 RepID=A0AAF6BYK0_MARPO|nr:hypothetical protein MARPO_0003s0194 [Marchantia polymorpha]BBN17084.1 hypothetical protein Mp_7g11830 [Marchantia polymorpha subsp. ruderalis]|eukprot:PTQ49319.1 hypothetical protein MARPO_0003s0194 [Marchantia polymorpha]